MNGNTGAPSMLLKLRHDDNITYREYVSDFNMITPVFLAVNIWYQAFMVNKKTQQLLFKL